MKLIGIDCNHDDTTTNLRYQRTSISAIAYDTCHRVVTHCLFIRFHVYGKVLRRAQSSKRSLAALASLTFGSRSMLLLALARWNRRAGDDPTHPSP